MSRAIGAIFAAVVLAVESAIYGTPTSMTLIRVALFLAPSIVRGGYFVNSQSYGNLAPTANA